MYTLRITLPASEGVSNRLSSHHASRMTFLLPRIWHRVLLRLKVAALFRQGCLQICSSLICFNLSSLLHENKVLGLKVIAGRPELVLVQSYVKITTRAQLWGYITS